MKTDLVSLFLNIVEQRSISAAANLAGITQSAASQRLKALESELGVELVDRTMRPLGLTAEGRVYYEGCRDLFQRYENLEKQVSARRAPVGAARWVVAAVYSADMGALLDGVKAYQEQRPNDVVEVAYVKPDQVVNMLLSEEAQLGVLSYPECYVSLGTVLLRRERFVAVCSEGHALSEKKVVSAEDMSAYPMIRFTENLPIERELRRYFVEQDVKAQVSWRFDNVHTIKAYLLRSPGWALLPEPLVATEQLSGALKCIAVRPNFARPLGLVWHGAEPTGGLAALMKVLCARYGSR